MSDIFYKGGPYKGYKQNLRVKPSIQRRPRRLASIKRRLTLAVSAPPTASHTFMSDLDFIAFIAATNGLGGEERTQIMARVSAAINADRVRFDPSMRSQ